MREIDIDKFIERLRSELEARLFRPSYRPGGVMMVFEKSVSSVLARFLDGKA